MSFKSRAQSALFFARAKNDPRFKKMAAGGSVDDEEGESIDIGAHDIPEPQKVTVPTDDSSLNRTKVLLDLGGRKQIQPDELADPKKDLPWTLGPEDAARTLLSGSSIFVSKINNLSDDDIRKFAASFGDKPIITELMKADLQPGQADMTQKFVLPDSRIYDKTGRLMFLQAPGGDDQVKMNQASLYPKTGEKDVPKFDYNEKVVLDRVGEQKVSAQRYNEDFAKALIKERAHRQKVGDVAWKKEIDEDRKTNKALVEKIAQGDATPDDMYDLAEHYYNNGRPISGDILTAKAKKAAENYAEGGVIYAQSGLEIPEPPGQNTEVGDPEMQDEGVSEDTGFATNENTEDPMAGSNAPLPADTTGVTENATLGNGESFVADRLAQFAVQPTPQQVQAKAVIAVPASGITSQNRPDIFDHWVKSNEAANKEWGELQVRKANELARQEDINLSASMALDQQWQEDYRKHKEKSDAAFQDMLNFKIDPNRIWHMTDNNALNAFSDISMVVGLALGAYGATLGHTENFALQAFEKMADRDMEAQKLDLGKRQSILSHYVEEGNDMMKAWHLAKADLMDSQAAQVKIIGDRFAGEEAQAKAAQLSTNLQIQADQMRRQATMQDTNILAAKSRIAANSMQIAKMKGDQNVQNQIASSPDGIYLSPSAVVNMDPKTQEKLVKLPNGKYMLAHDKKEASDVSATINGLIPIKQQLLQLDALVVAHSHAGFTFMQGDRDALKAADAISKYVNTELGKITGYNRLNVTEMKAWASALPQFGATSPSFNSTDRAGIKTVLDQIDRKIYDIITTSTIRPPPSDQ